MKNGEIVYTKAFWEGLEPDPDLPLDEWADRYRILSQKSSAEAGAWRTSRTPYLREIMRELSPSSPTQRIVFQKASQIGGSECGFNWLGYIIHLAPAPTMMVQPTDDLAKKISKQRIEPMIEESPVLRERVAPARERDSGNTMLLKEFRGGLLAMVGANSPVGLRSMPIKNLFCTEVSSYPADVGGEGDPVNLAEKRTQTFARRKVYLESTPTIKDSCRIEAEYLRSDQRRYFVPCPHCERKQWLKWANIKWDDEKPETASYMCEECGVLIEEHYKTWMLENGEWQATAPGDGKTVGFHLSSLYSPLGWKSWQEIVHEFIQVRTDAPRLKTWVTTVLGETWEEEYSAKVGADVLQQRAELYEVVPARVLVVVAGIDVQDNRIEISLWGFGVDEESWVISHQAIYGDPARPELWKQVDEVIFGTVEHEHFEPMKISVAAIDSGGHHTGEVYQYARERNGRNGVFVLAVKGQSQKGKPPIGKATKVDLNIKGQSLRRGAQVFPVGTDTIKSVIYGRLKHNQPGPGYIHFPSSLKADYFEQLTAEKLATRYVKGFPVREWTKKSGARNEALDCAVYAYAAMNFLYSRYARKTIWQQLERMLKLKSGKKEDKPVALPKPEARSTLKPMRKGFVSGF